MDITGLLQNIWDFFTSIFQNCANFGLVVFTWILNGVILVLGYTAFYMFDGFLSILEALLATLNLSAKLLEMVTQIAQLPPLMIWIMAQIGFFQAVVILIGAFALRFAINLIPSWATRV
jgi:hypothetical protein